MKRRRRGGSLQQGVVILEDFRHYAKLFPEVILKNTKTKQNSKTSLVCDSRTTGKNPPPSTHRDLMCDAVNRSEADYQVCLIGQQGPITRVHVIKL